MILDSSFPPDQRVEKEALSLLGDGHEVFLFSLSYRKLSPIENYRGIQVYRFAAGKLIYKLSALAYTVPFYRWIVQSKIKSFLIKCSIEVLHIHDMVIAEAALSANHKLKLPVVLDLHENRPAIMQEYKHVNELLGRWLIDLKRWKKKYYELAAVVDSVVVVTDLAKVDIMESTGKKEDEVIALPNTIHYQEFVALPRDPGIIKRMDGYFNLLYIGDTSLRRGTDLLIKVIHELVMEIPTIKLWIVGASSADKELLSLTKSLGMEAFVQFEGWKDNHFLPTYIEQAQVALSPLKKNLHHDTTYANKVFQYMTLGCPMVVSDCIAQANLVTGENCGLVYKSDSISDLHNAILELYRHPDKAYELGQNGKNAVQLRWNWNQTVKPLLSLYKRL